MELSQLSHIQALVKEIKGGRMFSNFDPYSFVSPSAYDTAWLAMIPDPEQPSKPMFENCLNWVLTNQREDGSWGDCDGHGYNPTIDSFPATLACIIVLNRWNSGKARIQNGLQYLQENWERLLGENYRSCPRWFAIVFPEVVELARAVGLEIVFPDRLKDAVMDIFYQRHQILEREELVDQNHYPPLLAYLEALPPSYVADQEEQIAKHLSTDGSLFQSPSATARAFMATGNENCLAYLQSVAQRCTNGVPPTYPIDEDLVKLCVVNQLQRLGLAEHFVQEIKDVLAQVYRNYKNQEVSSAKAVNSIATQIYKDSLAFRILRMHGYSVSPQPFCWFLNDQEIRNYIEKNHEHFSSVMLNVYRVTDLMFAEEYELQDAKSFARKLLEKSLSEGFRGTQDSTFASFQKVIKHELDLSWLTRMEHLEHRMWIEEKDMNALWMGKASFHRLSRSYNDKLIQLAAQNYEFRQSVYKHELEKLQRWSKGNGLSDMGFGREKTTYCYFAVAASIVWLPFDSHVRLIVAKSAILITVADDFFDMEGSLNELKSLTDAVKRWDDKGLSGHSKTIFEALDNLVRELAEKHLQQQGCDISHDLKDIWYETFASWLTEATRSKNGEIPSMDEYLETGMTSIASHTLVLTASCFLNPISLPNHKLRPAQYETLTKSLMIVTRLLNDIQGHQKEMEDGKINSVLLYLKENPEAEMEDSVAYVREIVANKEKEFLEDALMDHGTSELPESCKRLHLSCMKSFQMFYHSSNRYDSNTELIGDIQKAIYIPLKVQATTTTEPFMKPNKLLPTHLPLGLPLDYHYFRRRPKKKNSQTISSCYIIDDQSSFRNLYSRKTLVATRVRWPVSRNGYEINMIVPTTFRPSFV